MKIHCNAYDHIVQITVRAKQTKLNRANTQTHTHTLSHHARHYSHTHTHKRILRTLQIGHSQQQQQITVRSVDTKRKEKKKNNNNYTALKKREDTDTLLPFAADSFLVYGLLNGIHNSVSVWF